MDTEQHDNERLDDPARGKLWDAYQGYVACAESLGWEIKTFDEWLES